MKNRVEVMIGGMSYTVVAEDNEEYIKRAASLVDRKMAESDGSSLSLVHRAVLCALNIADDYYKGQEAASSLRQQIKEYSSEIDKLNSALRAKQGS